MPYALLIPFIILLALPLYFTLRKLGWGSRVSGRKTTFPLRNTPVSEEKRQVRNQLAEIRTGLETFYRYFLYSLIVLVTGFVIYLFATLPHDSTRAFVQFVGGVAYVFFLAWAVSELVSVRSGSRSSRRRTVLPPPNELFPGATFRESKDRGRIEFSFTLGAPPPPAADETIASTSADSTADAEKPSDAALAMAENYRSLGTDLDSICKVIDPNYRLWSAPRQEAYKMQLQAMLDRRAAAAPAAPSSGQPPAVSSGSPSAGPQKDWLRDLLRNPRAIVFIMIFTSLLVAFVMALVLWRRIQ